MVAGGAIRAGRAFVEIFADDNALVRGLARARARLRAFGAQVGNVGKSLVRFAAGVAAPIAIATKIFVGFSDAMLTVKGVTSATEEEFMKLEATAKLLGRTTSFTASQIAQAMVNLGRSNFNPQEIQDAIADILLLSRSTGTDLSEATIIATGTMRAFGLEATSMKRIVDTLTVGANSSSQTLMDMGEAMKLVAPAARAAGQDVETTAALIGILADSNIKGTLAGTALVRAFKNLSKTPVQKKLKELGIQALDAQDNLRPLPDVLRELAEATSDAGSGKILGLFDQLFGRGALPAKVLSDNTDKIVALTEKIRQAEDPAARLAELMDSELGGSFRMLFSAVEGVAIALAQGLAAPMKTVAKLVTEFSGRVTTWIEQNQEMIRVVTLAAAVIGALGVALIAVGVALKVLAFAITPIILAFGLLKVVLAGVIALFGAIVSPIGAVIAISVVLGLKFTEVGKTISGVVSMLVKRFDILRSNTLRAFGAIANALAAGEVDKAAEVLWASLRLIFAEGLFFLKNLWNKTLTNLTIFWSETVGGIQAIWAIGTKGIAASWTVMIGLIERTWETFRAGFDSSFESFKRETAKGFVIIQGAATGRKSSSIQKELNAIDRVSADRQRRITRRSEAAIKQSLASQEAKLTNLEESHRRNLIEISETLQDKLAEINKNQQGDTTALQAALKKANAEWQAAVKAAESAGKKTKAALLGGGVEGDSGTERPTDRQRRILQGLPEGPSQGALGAAAAFRLAMGSTDRRNQDANIATAKHTRMMVGELKKLTLPFPFAR